MAVSLGRFNNPSFEGGSPSADRLPIVARQLLSAQLGQSSHFQVVEGEDTDGNRSKAALSAEIVLNPNSAYAIRGDINELGRKEIETQPIFGFFGQGQIQVAHARVTLYVVDTATSKVVRTVHGTGEHRLPEKAAMGSDNPASLDAALDSSVLKLAIAEAVGQLTNALDSGAWRPAK